MPTYSLDGDRSGLPKTRRRKIPFEMEALTPREVYGAGNNASTYVCTKDTEGVNDWIKDMVGQVVVAAQTGSMLLKRYVPEPMAFGLNDGRVQFCTMLDQTEQYDVPADGRNGNFSGTNNWPACARYKYRATFEACPFAILDEVPVLGLPAMGDVAAAAAPLAGARELYRYVIRSRKTYSREQPIPAASKAGGFRIIVEPDTVPTSRLPIGQIGFQVVGLADVTYKWVRVPVGWPPPAGYAATNPARPWPPIFNPTAIDTTKQRTRDAYVGTINDDWFDVAAADGYAHPPGTLLYLGYDDSNKYYDQAGDWVCDVVFSFKQKRAVDNTGFYGGWNYYLDATGKWRAVSLDGTSTGAKPYKVNNFNGLFQYT